MTNRRQFLTGLPVAAAVGFTTTAGSSSERAAHEAKAAMERMHHGRVTRTSNVIDSTKRDSFPHLELTNQHGETKAFYENYIENRIVVMNFFSIRDEASFPITEKLSKVVAELGDKVGSEIQVVSITRDPEYDTPDRLKAFAAEFNTPEAWTFLTGSRENSSDLAFRMYRMGHSAKPSNNRKVDVIFYGNGSAGLWGAFPVDIQADDAASRVSWVMPHSIPADGKMRRAGPRVFDLKDPRNHNREV